MTDEEKLVLVKAQVDQSVPDTTIAAYLTLSAARILERKYPYDKSVSLVPADLDTLHCELAARMINRRGAEGETSHSENGVSRSYGSVDDSDILSRIVPFAGTIKQEETEDA